MLHVHFTHYWYVGISIIITSPSPMGLAKGMQSLCGSLSYPHHLCSIRAGCPSHHTTTHWQTSCCGTWYLSNQKSKFFDMFKQHFTFTSQNLTLSHYTLLFEKLCTGDKGKEGEGGKEGGLRERERKKERVQY